MNSSIKELIREKIEGVVAQLFGVEPPSFMLERAKKKEWGDVSTNLPFLMAGKLDVSPGLVGEKVASQLGEDEIFSKVEFAPPGFINFFLSSQLLKENLRKIVREREDFTRFSLGEKKPIQVEFVSANPTGPLHVGHGRAAVLGDVLANNLSKLGFEVQREYYVNNVGGQINRLAKSLLVRIRQLEGEKISLPQDGYKGEYLVELAKDFLKERGTVKGKRQEDILPSLCEFATEKMLGVIKADLEEFGVFYHRWFLESDLYESGQLEEVLSSLEKRNLVYRKDGALWFRTSSLIEGENDRVLRRKNGEYTYFASDIAYHQDKLRRGFHKVVDIWGADHIGYVPRMKAATKAIGYSDDVLSILIYQLVSLKKEGRKVSASTRKGEFISLGELLEQVGADVARFFFLSRSADSHLDFDLELAKKQTPENPVFYVQYAHARICSILRKAQEEGISFSNKVNLEVLSSPEEKDLMLLVALLPDQIKDAGQRLEPHHLTGYVKELASAFHYFYTQHRVISEDKQVTCARLFLVEAVRIAIKDILDILGICAPERM